MRIALLGTRGVPASYSGFETCVEQLGRRLVERGHEVTVYGRSHHIRYSDPTYLGMNLVLLPTVKNKYLDTIVHSLISSIHTLGKRFDIALYFIAGNSLVTWIPRIWGTKTILNVDGLDWKREKWPPLAKRYIQFAEWMATKLPNAYLTDSRAVQEYYRERFSSTPPYIPYGSEIERVPAGETLQRFGLEPRKYILFVGRLVPENHVEHLLEAFRKLDTDFKCVIVGDSAYADEYIGSLKALAEGDPRIVFTGYVFGRGYHELGSNAEIFVETSAVGGTHPAVVEAMAFGNCVIVNDTPENLETVGESGLAYNGKDGAEDLGAILDLLLREPETVERYRALARNDAENRFSWERVADDYERMFFQLIGRPLPSRLIEETG